MTISYTPIDLSRLTTYPLRGRISKVSCVDFAKAWKKGARFKDFLSGLPNILAGRDIQKVISKIVTAYENKRRVILGIGAHVIKVGLNPIVVDLMERGIISAVAMNGAGIIHDLELAITGRTSEDVATSLKDGTFGMARETGAFLGDAIRKAGDMSIGLGEAVGQCIADENFPYRDQSILATGYRMGTPVTVHIAIGTDIIHLHPDFNPSAAGSASHRDFRIFASIIADLEGGVYLNVGSAVILPEVFLKAVTLVRNLGYRLENFTTVNMDFIRQYRPTVNVVDRPTAGGGEGFNLIGHHEIMLPIIAAGIIEQIDT